MDKDLLQQHFPKLKFRHFNNEIENTHETIVYAYLLDGKMDMGFEVLKNGNLLAFINPDEKCTIKKEFENTYQRQLDAINWVKEQYRRHINELQSLLNLIEE